MRLNDDKKKALNWSTVEEMDNIMKTRNEPSVDACPLHSLVSHVAPVHSHSSTLFVRTGSDLAM
eukprot:2541859-Amphidinium_carterae.1